MEFVGPWTVHDTLFAAEKSTFAVTVVGPWTVHDTLFAAEKSTFAVTVH